MRFVFISMSLIAMTLSFVLFCMVVSMMIRYHCLKRAFPSVGDVIYSLLKHVKPEQNSLTSLLVSPVASILKRYFVSLFVFRIICYFMSLAFVCAMFMCAHKWQVIIILCVGFALSLVIAYIVLRRERLVVGALAWLKSSGVQ